MGGMLIPAEPRSLQSAAEALADLTAVAAVPQSDGASEPVAELASLPATEHMAAGEQNVAAAQPLAEPDVGQLPATAAPEADVSATAVAGGVQLQGRVEGVPSVPCFHAFIHAHAAAGDLRSDLNLSRPLTRTTHRAFGVALPSGLCCGCSAILLC